MALSNTFDYRQYLNLLLKRRYLFGLIAVVVISLGLVWTYLQPKMYRAQSTVFIEESVIRDLVRGIAVTPSMEARVRVLTTQFQSRTLILHTLQALNMDLEVGSDAELEMLIESTRRQMSVNLRDRQGIFTVSFTHRDPVLARDFVNTIVRRYIEENTSLKRDDSYDATQFLADQINVFKARLDDLEEQILTFRRNKGTMLTIDEATLRREIDQAEERLETLRLQRVQLQASTNVMHLANPYQERLRELEIRLAGLRQRYTDNHPDVRNLEAEISRVRAFIEEEGADSAQLAQRIRDREMEQLRLQIASITEQANRQQAIIERNKEILRELPTVQAELGELMEQRANQRLIYEQLVARYGQAEVSRQMELEDKSSSFRIVDPAVTPAAAISPNRFMLLFMTFCAGLAGAFGVIFGLDFLDNTVKHVDTLKSIGLPVLAVIPRIQDNQTAGKLHFGNIAFFLFLGVFFSLILGVMAMEFLGMPYVERLFEQLGLEQRLQGLIQSAKGLIKSILM